MDQSRRWNAVSDCIGILIGFFFLVTAVQAKHNSEHPLSAEEWREVMEKVVLLEPSSTTLFK